MTLSAFLVGLASGARQAGDNCAIFRHDALMRRAVAALIVANLLALLSAGCLAGPAAPASYRFAHRLLGFTGAEWLARIVRRTE